MTRPDILCIGAVLWDIIGRTPREMRCGSDVPGRITRLPGGVAFNIAMTLARRGMRTAILGVVGRDAEGDELIAACHALGVDTDYTLREDGLPTDRYLAIEGAGSLVSAIADARSLEAAGARILIPLEDGRLASEAAPWDGPVCLDGNLTEALLHEIATSPLFARARLHVAPASPGKAGRILALLGHPSAVLHVNREEAGIICDTQFGSAADAALGLVARGAARAVVTDGAGAVADALGLDVITALPPQLPAAQIRRITGAGDTFMAAHITATNQGADRDAALATALGAAAAYISKENPA